MLKLLTSITLIISTLSRINFCPWGNYPVCGIDNKTYNNQCDLMVSYVELSHSGPCKKLQKNGEYKPNCPQNYSPICGRDGVTYLNKCRLAINKITKAYSGPCGSPNHKHHPPIDPESNPLHCDCLGSPFQPLCSLQDQNYENSCVLNCSQQIPSSPEPCKSACNCIKKYNPVCGVDGMTYDNKCTLDCVKVVKQGEGECPSLLRGCEFCSRVLLPACGRNNMTYRNLCEMRCNNVRFSYFGKCKLFSEEEENGNNCGNCSDFYSPVCGSDGFNYRNECFCDCRKDCVKYSNGFCPDHPGFDCERCGSSEREVCGSDGVTYRNSCFCNCKGQEVLKNGACIGSSV